MQTIHNISSIMIVSVLSSTRTKKMTAFCLFSSRQQAVVSLPWPHLAKKEVGRDRSSFYPSRAGAQGEALSMAPLASAPPIDQLHHPKDFWEVIPYLFLLVAAVGAPGSNNFHTDILPLQKSDTSGMDHQCLA